MKSILWILFVYRMPFIFGTNCVLAFQDVSNLRNNVIHLPKRKVLEKHRILSTTLITAGRLVEFLFAYE